MRTVSVPIFDNQSFYQDVEFDLTEALVKEIELRTPYKVTGADRADTILQGEIVSVTSGQTEPSGDRRCSTGDGISDHDQL